ncbi:MAG TPA: HEPN domain-containing protein [Candidatus Nanoarchaeia archaeon]|nr:HEPN domain-containing protein [Candidatus Nanoarchaeia archaeon]
MEADSVNVASGLFKNFLRKAEECHTGMNAAFAAETWNMAVIAAVHCAISSADALTVKFLGVRNGGTRHESVVKLLNQLNLADIGKKNRQLLNLLRIKSTAEYEERLMSKSDAEDAVRDAERFHKWAKEVLGE